MRILFMLPARSGSKGIKDKNIKDLNGKPLMYYAIHAIQESRSYQNHECCIMVNTDSEGYAEIARECGAEVPFLRPKELAQDDSVVTDTIRDTIRYFDEKDQRFDLFSMVQITSPLLTGKDIDHGVELFEKEKKLDFVNAVTETEIMPLWCNTLPDDGSMNGFVPKEIRTKNRQELPRYYRITGAVRMARWNSLKQYQYDWYEGNTKALIMEQKSSIDIDTELDFELAKLIMKGREKHEEFSVCDSGAQWVERPER